MNAEPTALSNAAAATAPRDTRPPLRAGLRARLTDLLSDAAIYGASSMLGQVIGFLLLPLYTDFLSERQYGILAMLAIVTMLFGGLGSAAMASPDGGAGSLVGVLLLVIVVYVPTILISVSMPAAVYRCISAKSGSDVFA